MLPFDFEKRQRSNTSIPSFAYPKEKFLASVDDNFGCPGYSLVERGLCTSTCKSHSALRDYDAKGRPNYFPILSTILLIKPLMLLRKLYITFINKLF